MKASLESLDSLDWQSLQHAYGEASDTPDAIARLVAPSSATQRRALRQLSHSIYHQSGGYSASPAAMPFLLELLEDERVRRPDLLMQLICELGIPTGYHYPLATGWVDPTPWLQRWYGQDDSTQLAHFLECRRLFEQSSERFSRLFATASRARLRRACAFALAWLPEHASASLPLLQQRYAREPNLRVRVASLLAIGLLSQSLRQEVGETGQVPNRQEVGGTGQVPNRQEVGGTGQVPNRQEVGETGQVPNRQEPRQELRTWLLGRCPRSGPLRGAWTLAMLYLSDDPEPMLQEGIELIGESIELYPFEWFSGELSEMAAALLPDLSRRRGWPLLELLQRHFEEAGEKSVAVRRRLARCLLQTAFPEPRRVASFAELGPLEQRSIDAILRQPELLDIWMQESLRSAGLPGELLELLRWRGILPAEAPPPTLRQRLEPCGLRRDTLSSALLELRDFDPAVAIARFYPCSASLLERGETALDFELLSSNPRICFDDHLLERFAHRWSWWDLAKNPSLRWTRERLQRFHGHLHWRAISGSTQVDWSEELLAHFEQDWDWDLLSQNPSLPWSEALIEAYKDRWSWHLLSQNPSLPWSEKLLRRYRRWYWNYLSGNDGLPWSEAFIALHRERLDGCQLCKVSVLPWSVDLIERLGSFLECWGNLSANPGLPWSTPFVKRYSQRWNWSILSANRALPWSVSLLRSFAARWDWSVLLCNPALPWQESACIDLFLEHAESASNYSARYRELQLRWTPALLQDERLRHLLCHDDRILFDRVLAPVLDDQLVLEILSHAQQQREAAWRECLEALPKEPGFEALRARLMAKPRHQG